MSSVVISGDTSGAITLAAPAVSGTNTATLPAATGTVMVSGNMPAFNVTKSSGQSITGGVTTKVTFDTETFDTNNNFASDRFTPTAAGYYQININLGFGTTGSAQALLYKNGSQYYGGTAVTYNASIGGVMPLSVMVYMNGSTDYLEVYTYSVLAISISAGSTNTQFSGSLVRGA